MSPPIPRPIIDDARARAVRQSLFEQDVRMKDLLGKQLTHLESIEEGNKSPLAEHVPAMIGVDERPPQERRPDPGAGAGQLGFLSITKSL